MRTAVVQTLVELANAGAPIDLLTADLGFKVLDPFREALPFQFFNMGVAEANMISVAAGLAIRGRRPVCYSMVPFVFMRAFEQFRLDVVAQALPVVLVGVGGGLTYAAEGVSHHAIEDFAMARALPGLRVFAPGDPIEAIAATNLAVREEGPTFIRLGANNDPFVHEQRIIDIRSPISIVHSSSPIVLLSTGHILSTAFEAVQLLKEDGIEVKLVSVPVLKPFPAAIVATMLRNASAVFTLEEHSVVGGLGTEVAEILLTQGYTKTFLKLGLPDAYCPAHGTLSWLRKQHGIDSDGIAARIKEHMS